MIMEYKRLLMSEIVVGRRVRKELGELHSLIKSIETVGLLHPIVVNTKRELVAGGRRLEAVKRIGWVDVPTVIVDGLDETTEALKAERDENTCRKPWTVTEMAEMGRQLEELERPKAKEASNKNLLQNKDESEVENFHLGGKVRDKVGEALGVSGKTYEKAKVISEDGIDELKNMVDHQEVSIDAANEIAKLPKSDQARIVEQGPDGVKKAAKAKRQAKQKNAPKALKHSESAADGHGTDVDVTEIEFHKQIEQLCREIDRLKHRVESWKQNPQSYSIHFPTIVGGLTRLREDLWSSRTAFSCPYCETNGARPDCHACKGTQRVCKTTRNSGEHSMKRSGGMAS